MGDPGLASKHVEAQLEDAERERFERENRTERVLSFAEIERRESLRLSIERTRQQLERATNPKYRKTLNRALKALKSEL